MTSIDQPNLLGIGIYSPDEAAMYARVATRTMQRWVFGDGSGSPVIHSQLSNIGEEEKLVTFLVFVQVMAVRQVRLAKSAFPLQKIRTACDIATHKYGLDYPLAAKEHRIYLFGPKDRPALCELLILVGDKDDAKREYIMLSGGGSGNLVMADIAEPFMNQLHFGESPFAEQYVAWERGGRQIVMNPKHRLGEPYLPSCGYTARGLWDAYKAEDGVENAAAAYDVEKEDVELACEYFDYLIGRDAA